MAVLDEANPRSCVVSDALQSRNSLIRLEILSKHTQ
jgi:hypothetical protein